MGKGHNADDLRERVVAHFRNRCSYCLAPQHLVYGLLELEHIKPTAKGGGENEQNLCLACRLCNNFKGVQTHGLDPVTGLRTRLFHSRKQRWSRHFAWSDDGTHILGRTPYGRATVLALRLNNLTAVTVRRQWTSVGWHPPKN